MSVISIVVLLISLNNCSANIQYFANFYGNSMKLYAKNTIAVIPKPERYSINQYTYCDCVHRNKCNPMSLEGQAQGDFRYVLAQDEYGNKNYFYRPRCQSYNLICCFSPEFFAPVSTQLPQRNQTLPSIDKNPATHKANNIVGPSNYERCGYTYSNLRVNNNTVFRFPWSVSIRYNNEDVLEGSLINKYVVLVDAVSIYRYNVANLTVHVGNEYGLYYQYRKVKSLEINPYFMDEYYYDAHALLFLNEPFILSYGVGIVCLPERNENFDGKKCFADGEKQQADQFLAISGSECQKSLRETSLGDEFRLHLSLMCAKSVDKSKSIRNYSGGSLVCPMKNDPSRYVQVGIFTEAYSSNDLGSLNVLVDTRRSRGWIADTMKAHGFNFNYN